MIDLFRLTETDGEQVGGRKSLEIGVEVNIAGRKTFCSISRKCHSYEELLVEVKGIQDNLKHIVDEANKIFHPVREQGKIPPTADMSAEEIWRVLCGIEHEEEFVRAFNEMTESQRKQVGEHVFTKCNIFSGKAAVFSARYDAETTLME